MSAHLVPDEAIRLVERLLIADQDVRQTSRSRALSALAAAYGCEDIRLAAIIEDWAPIEGVPLSVDSIGRLARIRARIARDDPSRWNEAGSVAGRAREERLYAMCRLDEVLDLQRRGGRERRGELCRHGANRHRRDR